MPSVKKELNDVKYQNALIKATDLRITALLKKAKSL
jgi:hypothetical protein